LNICGDVKYVPGREGYVLEGMFNEKMGRLGCTYLKKVQK
jgi:hypothetical protein